MAAADTDADLPDTLPPVLTEHGIRAELALWRRKLIDARNGTGTTTEQACLQWLDRWLDELNNRRRQ